MLHFSRYFFIATAQGTNGITALNLALPIYGIIFAIGSMIELVLLFVTHWQRRLISRRQKDIFQMH